MKTSHFADGDDPKGPPDLDKKRGQKDDIHMPGIAGDADAFLGNWGGSGDEFDFGDHSAPQVTGDAAKKPS